MSNISLQNHLRSHLLDGDNARVEWSVVTCAAAAEHRNRRLPPSTQSTLGRLGTEIMIRAMVVALGSVPIIWFSRRSLLRPASHGFSRFFAFEAILALVVINGPRWFVGSFRTRQVVSWLLLAVSAVLVVWGVVLLRRFGRSRRRTEGAPEFQWENTTNLVATGIYRYIRHPMYSSLLFLTWGALLKSVSTTTLALAVIATIALVATARVEEREDLARFGDEYREYMKRTRRFVPFVV